MNIFSCYIILVNIIAFTAMGIDKNKAKRGKWRIPEKTLMFFASIGGSLGMILGMNLFRHKTKHKLFTIGAPLILVIQVIILYILYVD